MAETATKERTERTTQQAFDRAEDTIGTIMDSGRQTLMSMVEFNRHSIKTSYEFARNIQEESLRLTDAWFDNISRFQKNYIKSFHDYNSRVQDLTEKTAKENTDRMEEALEQGMELVASGSRPARRR